MRPDSSSVPQFSSVSGRDRPHLPTPYEGTSSVPRRGRRELSEEGQAPRQVPQFLPQSGQKTPAEAAQGRDQVRAALAQASTELMVFMDAGRDRLGLRLAMVETSELAVGRRPPWWQEDWT